MTAVCRALLAAPRCQLCRAAAQVKQQAVAAAAAAAAAVRCEGRQAVGGAPLKASSPSSTPDGTQAAAAVSHLQQAAVADHVMSIPQQQLLPTALQALPASGAPPASPARLPAAIAA